YEFGRNGNRKCTDCGGAAARIDYTYDELDRVSTLSRNGTPLASYEYCLDSTCGGFYIPGTYPRKRTVYLGGGRSVQSQFEYDDHRRLNVIATSLVTPAGTQNIATFNSAFDDLGNRRTSQVNSATLFAEAATFEYDDLDRLTLADYTGPPTSVGDESFDLDSLGNREAYANTRAGTPTLVYGPNDSANRYSTINGLSVEHDADGNLTRSAAGHTLTYDHEHRLVQVDSALMHFDYDALGRRIVSKLATGTTYHYYDGQRIVAENEGTTAAATPARYFVDGPLYVDEHLLLHENDRDYAYLLGPLYSVMGLVDDTGVVMESYHYDAYGAPAELPASGQASAAGSRYLSITPPNYGSTRFAIHVQGDESDAETACVDLYARKVCEMGSANRQDCATDADCPKTCEGGVEAQPCTSDSQCLPLAAGFKCLGACTGRGLGDGPVYLTSAEWGVVTVGHGQIHPSTEYDVSFVFEGSGATSPIAMTTRKWADVDGNGSVNVLDVAAAVDAVMQLRSAQPFAAANIWDCPLSDGVNVLDIASAVDAVKGKPFPCTPSCGTPRPHNPYRFTGRRLDWIILDAQTGAIDMILYDYRARSYDARLGRFLQPDPAGYVDGMNLYEYVRSNPGSASDPFGLQEQHHYAAQAFWQGANLSEEVRSILDETVPLLHHKGYSIEHRMYNAAVRTELSRHLGELGKGSISDLTADEARALVATIRGSEEPAIRRFLDSGGAKYLGRPPGSTGLGGTVGGAALVVLTTTSTAQAAEIPYWERIGVDECVSCVCQRVERIKVSEPWYDLFGLGAIDHEARGPEESRGTIFGAQCRALETSIPIGENEWRLDEISMGYQLLVREEYVCFARKRQASR
ncbi:MAG: RHS repeat-associated core domain-containing protein, partial [Planctomycetota bacterium]